MRFVDDGTGDLIKTFGTEDVFRCIYAVFHSPAYRERHAQFSRADFPIGLNCRKGARRGMGWASAHQQPKPFLLEMAVVGQSAVYAHPLHDIHGNAILQAMRLIRAARVAV